MDGELDQNKLIVEFINSRIDQIGGILSAGIKGTRERVLAAMGGHYRHYISRILDQHAKAKSFFIRSEPLPIYNFFVAPDLTNDRRTLHMPDAIALASIARSAVVTGLGGCGKSMFMRHLLVSTIRSREKTPILLELRQLNTDNPDLRAALLVTLRSNGLDIDESYFIRALESGHFCVLLDGFDELERRHRKTIAAQIQNLARLFPNNWLVISSRPELELQAWNGFSVFAIAPFDLARAIELVEKLPFDSPVKGNFIQELKAGLYEKHKSFLSNALLLSIMLLTYSDNAKIPNKLSIFYNQAYESLFQRHDALKSGFRRQRRTQLDIQDFGNVFAAFCVLTYDKRKFSFTRTSALEFLDHGKALSRAGYDSDAFLDDAVQAVSLMMEDGLEITFAHRSFQEYFVARFIRSSPPAIKSRLIRQVATHEESDSVIRLLHEMDPYAVEVDYVLPGIDSVRQKISLKRKVGITHWLRFIKTVYSSFEAGPNDENGFLAVIKDIALWLPVRFAHQAYYSELGRVEQSVQQRESVHEIMRLFRELAGDANVLPTKQLTASMPFTRALAASPDIWGHQFLTDVVEIADVIRRRHRETESSLESIVDSMSISHRRRGAQG